MSVQEFTRVCSFINVEDHFTWALWVFMAIILKGIESFFRMKWQVCSFGGTYLDALGVTITSPTFLPNYGGVLDFIFDQGLMDLPLVGGIFTWSNNWDLPFWSTINKCLVSSN